MSWLCHSAWARPGRDPAHSLQRSQHLPHHPHFFPCPTTKQDAIHAAFKQRNAAQDALLGEQAALAALVSAAAAALEQHAAGAAASGDVNSAAAVGSQDAVNGRAALAGGPQPLSEEQLASLATPAGTAGREVPRRGRLLDASAEAEALEQLLEDGWLGRGAAAAAARALDKGEQAVSSKEGGEEAAAVEEEEVGESSGGASTR